MTYREFIAFRDVRIKNPGHERVVRLFYPYLQSVSGDAGKLPDLFGRLLGLDLSAVTVPAGCFNGVNDGAIPPYADVDFYVRLSDKTRIFCYGSPREAKDGALAENEYAVFVYGASFDSVERGADRHIYIR